MHMIRTDLAVESEALRRGQSADGASALPGVRARRERRDGFSVVTVEVLDRRGEEALGKPRGTYVTVELDAFIRREENAFCAACAVLSGALRALLKLEKTGSVLVVGLGNRDVTPDAVGPAVVDCTMVTRHLRAQMPDAFGTLRPVAALCSGVLGTTGIESRDLVRAVTAALRPDAVIAVDALASRAPERLCRTVQIADTGIVPGSGVGNAREALDRGTLGVPVYAVGVPTVVDAATLAADLAERAGVSRDTGAFGAAQGLIVTPRDIDRNVRDIAKLIGYSLNLALHDGLTIGDVDLFLS